MITVLSTHTEVWKFIEKKTDELFQSGSKEVSFDFIDKACKMELVFGERYKDPLIKYTIGDGFFSFVSHSGFDIFWLYVSLLRNKSGLLEFFDCYKPQVINITLWSELCVLAHYCSHSLSPENIDALLKTGDYQDRVDERHNLVVNTFKILKDLQKAHYSI